MTLSSSTPRRIHAGVLAFCLTAVGVHLPDNALAQGIGATGKQRVLVVPIQRSESVSSVVPGRVDEYVRTLLGMSGKIEVLGLTDLVEKPETPAPKPIETDKNLVKADDALWDAKEAASKGAYGKAIKLFKRSAKLYEKRFDKLVDFDKYIDAALGVSLAYFLAGYEDNGEDALAPVVVMRPDLILDKRKVPKTAVAALDRLLQLYAGGTKGSISIESKPPGAEVFIDGNRVGVTPHTVKGLHRGRHIVRLVQPGFEPYAKSVNAGARDQRVRHRLKAIAKPKSKKEKSANVVPKDLVDAVAEGSVHRGFSRLAKPIADRFNLDAIALFYLRKTPERLELAPFLWDRQANRIAALDWIHLDHNLTTMQVNLIVLDEKLNQALANFPMSRVLRKKSEIYDEVQVAKPEPKPEPPRPVVIAPPKPTPAPPPPARPAPKPRPVVSVKPAPTPRPAPKPRVQRPAPRPQPIVAAQPQPPAPRRVAPLSIQLDDGLGGNLGSYPYPNELVRPTLNLPPPRPISPVAPATPNIRRVSSRSNAWYKQWWVWTIVGAAVAGGTTTALVLTLDSTPEEYGGTVQW